MTAADPFVCIVGPCVRYGQGPLEDKGTDASRAEYATSRIFLLYCAACGAQNHWRDGQGAEQFNEMKEREAADV